MSKEKRQKRFQQKKRHIKRQTTIYNDVMGSYKKWIPDNTVKLIKNGEKSDHIYHKRKSLNCGDPTCVMCMNPRKAFGMKTLQEVRFECSAVEQTNRDAIGKWEWQDLNDPAMEW